MITLIKAFRTDENTVYVMFLHNERAQRFVIEWNNVHAETGNVENYDLQIKCLSQSELLNDIVEQAISDGDDSELYVAIRDSFDNLDCEGLE